MIKKAAKPKKPNKPAAPPAPADASTDAARAATAFPIVGVGASAGGLEAFSELLSALPLDTGMGFVLVQHLDPLHESALTQLLARATSLPVREVTNDLRVEPNCVYVIPPNTNLSISAGVLKLQPRGQTRTPARSIDSFFESLAADQRERAIGVILSGTASDGTLGLEAIKAEGGITFAQDDSARYDSMPHSAVAAGCVDLVLSPAGIAKELARLAKHPYVAGAVAESSRPERDHALAVAHEDDATPLPSGGSGTPDVGAQRARAEAEQGHGDGRAEDGFKKVLLLLRNHCGIDFSLYKSSTIQRRIARRMMLSKHDTLEHYARFLRGNAKELDALFSDVLISVTSFFRNPDAFGVLQQQVLPKLLAQRGDEPVRVWVLGCSTGQEAYSIAMAFVEAAENAPRARKLQVFATDLNDALLDKARHGLYASSLAQDLSPERLRRFFVEEGGGWRINKSLREMVVFARQNLISDPPFSRMDLITCRNLLIYLEPELQKKVFPVFHYALRPEGFLWLGASESIGGFTELFEPLDRKHKIYSKKAASTPAFALPVKLERGHRPPPARLRAPGAALAAGQPHAEDGLRAELTAQREADRITLHQFAPPGVLVNAELQILQFRGATSAYLEPASGKASFDLLKMAREGLTLPLRAAVNKAKQDNKTVRKENVRIGGDNGAARTINIEVIPLKNLRERCFLILFEDAGKAAAAAPPPEPPPPPRATRSPRAELRRIAELEAELAETREYLQSIEENHEAANEELQAAGEEVQSANEELQSLNEELTTSKEELESSNEELTTVNDEMAHRNAELVNLSNDLANVQTSAQLVIVLLGRDLRIRRFSTQAEKQFNLLASDLGRPIGNIRHRLDLPDLEALVSEVIATVQAQERELQDSDGHWYSLRVRPYLTLDNKVDGAVLVLVEIDTLKRAQAVQARLAAIVTWSDDAIVSKNLDGVITSWNKGAQRLFGYSAEEAIGQPVTMLIPTDHIDEEPDILARVRRGETVDHYQTVRRRKDGSLFDISLTVSPIRDASGQVVGAAKIARDITERRQAEQALQGCHARFEALFDASPIGMYLVDAQLRIRLVSRSARPVFGDIGELIGRNFVEVIHILWEKVYADELVRLFRHTLDTGEPYATPERIERRLDRGVTEYYQWQIHRIALAGGAWGVVCYFQDISAQVMARAATAASEQRLRFVMDSAPQKIFTATPAGDVDYFNPAWMEFTGLTFELIRDWGWTQFIHPDDVDVNTRVWQHSIDSGEPFQFEHRFRRADGEYRWHLSRALAMRGDDGEVVMWVGSNTDIHEQLQTQDRLRQYADDLRAADRRKDEFQAMLAHELRNPLAPIRNALARLRRPAVPEPARQSALQIMERQVAQMVRLVDDLLDVNRISRGRIELRSSEVDLSSLVQQVAEGARPLCDSMGQALTLALPSEAVLLDGDAVRLTQVVGNLVNNASKFTDRGGRIAIALEAGGGQAVLRVSDTGIGIAADQLTNIFEMFTQVEGSRARSAGGLGIGLALVKDLVTLHGGTVAAHSAGAGRGSEFVVRLPLKDRAAGAPAQVALAQAGEAVATTALRILVVDDNRDAAESLAELLQLSGYQTQLAHDGLEAVQAAAAFEPDVILLDLGLPKLDGYEAARRIRAQNAAKRPLVVALTGWGEDEDRRRSAQAGFDAHLVKPVETEALMKLLLPTR